MIPNTTSSISERTVRRPGDSVCTRSDRSARFTVAVAAYTMATAVRNSSDDNRLTVTYVMPARIVCVVVRRVMSTYDAVSMISNETNSVNRSPDR